MTKVLRIIGETGSAARLHDCVIRKHVVPPRNDIVSGTRTRTLHLLVSGLAARYCILGNGTRQITALILPGDLCNLEDAVTGHGAANVVAITACVIGEIPQLTLVDGGALRSEWTAFAFQTMARETAIAAEWIVSLGRRSAYEAMAHLFCELWVRFNASGIADETGFAFKLTHVDLADMLGMTPVHVSRTLRNLRQNRLVILRRRRVTILDDAALARAAYFDPSYLHVCLPVPHCTGQPIAQAVKPSDRCSKRTPQSSRLFERPA